jgi:hypothetical protein
MQSGDEEYVRRIAYELWEKEGRPHGRHDQHWHQARHATTTEVTQAHSGPPRSTSEAAAVPSEKPGKAKSGKPGKKKG